ncbi:hypothetical protein G6F57_009403 [Rhizopus arrhizus]|uniref:Uncharacterized protein n=1 Tax=Rhizopus oryzae TaxID=64495 RepID=A0A9P6X3E5_RHIOR|nr:hypothetical protein G6F30_010034 [Rhizopus arrhizus]KAG0988033.1 hypothetical protein G6F29_002056 [Rhizopus arrhizus]KAG1004244.1 hypothetical protein G6F27_010318 [Rhizopus arrhizus]KAG1033997.1 hypothetical protein G6F25_010024 [Rhizopus arrhizus]KAG1064502.1 hypothetical protein G6F41_009987 [Rhizopus arrhizus]
MTRNSDNNLQTRYEWFMKWKGSDLGYTKNCVFIDEDALKTAKQKKRRKLAGGKEQRAGDNIIEEPIIEYVNVEKSTAIENHKPVAKGTTTAHFVRFINELLDIMDMDESLMDRYLVMDYCIIHQKKLSKSENDSFELYVEDNSDDDLQPVVTARKRKSREDTPQVGLQKRLKGKGKVTDSEVTITSSTGISTDETIMFNKITFDDYDLEYIKGRQEARVNQDVKEEWVCSLLNQ